VEAENQSYCSIGSDNFQGGFRATSHLIRLGRQRIVYLGQAPALPTAQTMFSQSAVRLAGFRAAIDGAGLSLDPAMIQAATGTAEAGADAIENLLERSIAFDGIVAASDMIAIGAVRALQQRGVDVPRDVSVIGYDDSDIASYARPRLTTVRQDTLKAGNLLVSKLLRLMDGHSVASERLPTDIVIRDPAGRDRGEARDHQIGQHWHDKGPRDADLIGQLPHRDRDHRAARNGRAQQAGHRRGGLAAHQGEREDGGEHDRVEQANPQRRIGRDRA
jgi:DNA-binding LacI/PurR family transcriptional regulator